MTDTITDTLIWLCDVCGKPVADKKGYITVSAAEERQHHIAYDEWKAAQQPWVPMNITELMAIPRRASWHVYHRRCDPQTGSQSDYWIGVERARTDRDLLAWTAHLLGKDWLGDTDWDEFLYAAMKANGGRCHS